MTTPEANNTNRWKSVAYWPAGTFPCDHDVTTDQHDSEKEAQGVCDLLQRKGAGGDRKVYPIKTEVIPPAPVATEKTAEELRADYDALMIKAKQDVADLKSGYGGKGGVRYEPVATERPTVETDAEVAPNDPTGTPGAYVTADFARSLERQRDELAERLAESEADRVQAEKGKAEANSRSERELEKLKALFNGIEDSDPINDKLEKWQQNIEATLVADLTAAKAELQEILSSAPWEKLTDEGAWKCRECRFIVVRGNGYPTHHGHKSTCSHSAQPIIDRAEKAESELQEARRDHEVAVIAQREAVVQLAALREERDKVVENQTNATRLHVQEAKELRAIVVELRADRDALAKALEIAERHLGIIASNNADDNARAAGERARRAVDEIAAIRGGKQEGES